MQLVALPPKCPGPSGDNVHWRYCSRIDLVIGSQPLTLCIPLIVCDFRQVENGRMRNDAPAVWMESLRGWHCPARENWEHHECTSLRLACVEIAWWNSGQQATKPEAPEKRKRVVDPGHSIEPSTELSFRHALIMLAVQVPWSFGPAAAVAEG